MSIHAETLARMKVLLSGERVCGVALRFDLFCLLLYAHSCLLVASAPPLAHPRECAPLRAEQACPPNGDACPCIIAAEVHPSDHASVLCCHLASATQLWSGIKCAVTGDWGGRPVDLHVHNSTLEGLGQSLSVPRPLLSSLSVSHSAIPTKDLLNTTLTAMASTVACLNLSSNGMGDLPAGALMGLGQLVALDLSHNNITQLPDLPLRTDHKSLWVDISGNERLRCSGIKEAMSWNNNTVPADDLSTREVLSNSSSSPSRDSIGIVVDASSFPPPAEAAPPVVFHNKEGTYCIALMKDLWFHWAERIPLDKIEDIIKLECPTGPGYTCACSIKRFEQSDFSVAVDCSGRGLTKLPVKLPNHTTSLNVTNNKISSLEPFGMNKCYSKIRDFYADNNEITSIEPLEGSDFMNNFQHLYLSGNKLTNLPMYILNRMFNQDSHVIRYLTLGKNEYQCDCNTYSGLKDWILHNKKQVTDHEEMLCNSELYNTRIIDLHADDVCLQKDWKDYLPIVVLVEVLLLIIIVTKVSYDYWIFKTKGYLPWPASRTPKLPCCDWAFDA